MAAYLVKAILLRLSLYMRIFFLIFVLLLISCSEELENSQKLEAQCGSNETVRLNFPGWAIKLAKEQGLNRQFVLNSRLNPFYQNGDFNGNGQLDIAVSVRERNSCNVGIMLIDQLSGEVNVLGASHDFGNGGADFEWLTGWYVIPRSQQIEQGATEEAPPKLIGDALFLEGESASAVVYWNGSEYRWYQQGD